MHTKKPDGDDHDDWRVLRHVAGSTVRGEASPRCCHASSASLSVVSMTKTAYPVSVRFEIYPELCFPNTNTWMKDQEINISI